MYPEVKKEKGIAIHYEKRKNIQLFHTLEREDVASLLQLQNYVPLYQRFFALNDTNYNNINLRNTWFINSIKKRDEQRQNIYQATLKNSVNEKTKPRDVFIKMAPLLDPFKCLIGKLDSMDPRLQVLPSLTSSTNVHPNVEDPNNSAYVDSFFVFLTSQLLQHAKFVHGVDFYGSFLGIKKQFALNIYDDLEYLQESDYFNKNKNVLFHVDPYDCQWDDEEKKPVLHIQKEGSQRSLLSLHSVKDELFENMFEMSNIATNNPDVETTTYISLEDVKQNSIDLIDITNDFNIDVLGSSMTIKSESTCSSRSSYTQDEITSGEQLTDDYEEDGEEKEDREEDGEEKEKEEEDGEEETLSEERVEAILPHFPVQVICMEDCGTTFDDYILRNQLSEQEWFSAFMQVIMILLTYQQCFSFTHNDLHTNNVMFVHTEKEFLYYSYKKTLYRVPTFGKLFKIIDFGRAIYKFNGKLFCSNSFQEGGDAVTQYNMEPYFNEKKPRLEPNYSFDITRLACSLFDHLVDDITNLQELIKHDKVLQLVVDWCNDDKGNNVLYKKNGDERYPDFKLYKMIARCVHRHTPHAQLERDVFQQYIIRAENISEKENVMNIDSLASYLSA